MISRIIVGVFLDILRPFFRSDFRLNLRQLMVAVFFLAIVLNAFPMYAKSKSYDEIFKQVFGRIPEKQYFRQQMALVVDYQFVGDDLVVLVPSVGTDYKLYSYTLLKYLYDNQKPGTLREFTQKIDDDGMVAVDQLESMGYRITVDRRAFRVSIDIPPEFRKKIIYYVMGGPDDDIVSTQKTTVKPANLSAYLNYSFSTNYIASELDDSENGLEAPRGAFLGLVKSGQYGLNYAGSVDMSNDEVVNMSVLNLERDFGLKNKRYLLGQISPMTKGSQATLSLLGVGITQGPILNSIGNFSPRFSHELILDVDSQVDIYINYQKVKSVNLPGGIYELKGFPLRTGFNVIKIVKTSVYDIVPSTKDDLVTDGVYNDINEGVLYKTKANQNESFLDQSLRLHNARIVSSEWLASDKVPRKGVQIEDDSPPVKKKVVTEFVYPFALDPVLYAPKYNELSYGIGFPATWSGLNLATSDQVTQSLYYKKGLNNFITSTVYT
ncbi:MAG: hypothetical protein VW500_06020, partial [Aquiluna sp.]